MLNDGFRMIGDEKRRSDFDDAIPEIEFRTGRLPPFDAIGLVQRKSRTGIAPRGLPSLRSCPVLAFVSLSLLHAEFAIQGGVPVERTIEVGLIVGQKDRQSILDVFLEPLAK